MKTHQPSLALIIRCSSFFIPMMLLSFSTGDSKSNYTIPLSAYSVTTADLDLDGDKDIICGHNVNTSTQWSGISRTINNSGYFTLLDSVEFFGWQGSVQAINIDINPIPEIIAKYEDFDLQNEYIGILYNNSGLIKYFSLDTYEGVDKITTGLINNDSYADLIISSTNGDMWGVLFNDGNGNFFEPEYYYAYYPMDIKCGNLNNDIYDDIVVAGGDVNIILPNGSGFEEIFFSNGYNEVFIDDFDLDGDNDIFEINRFYPFNFFSFLENMGNNDFFQHPDTTTHPGGHDFFVADLNNDNFSEIIFVDNNMYGVCIYYNLGGFNLSNPVYIQIEYFGESSRGIHCDDLDGNGYNDIIVIRKHGALLPANLTILFNDGNGNFVEDPITKIQTSNSKLQTLNLFCYPNPFTTSTQICYEVENASSVTINVYHYTGRLIKSFNHGLMNKGSHCVEFRSDGLPSGIYFCSLEVNGIKTNMEKMILMN